MSTPAKRRPPPPGRHGKRPSLFKQRDIERASRAAPDRTIRICRDGSIELIPPGKTAATEKPGNPWDEVLKSDAKNPQRSS